MYFIVYKKSDKIFKKVFPNKINKYVLDKFLKEKEILEFFKNKKLSVENFFNDYKYKGG